MFLLTAWLDFTDTATSSVGYLLVGEVKTEIASWITAVISQYWGTILSIAFVLFLIALFWRMAKLKGR